MKNIKDNLAQIKIAQGPGIPTGFPQLDEMINGFTKGELTLIAGRPGMGKTAIMNDLAMFAAQNYNTGIFSLEMGLTSLVTRMIASKQNVTFKSLVRGEVKPNAEVTKFLENSHLSIDDRAGISSADIQLGIAENSTPFDIVFIDYLQLVRPPTAKRQRYEEVDRITEHLRNIAKHFNVAMVLTCQLNREIDKRDKHEPRLADLRESGGIEQTCDKIILLHRPSYWHKFEENNSEIDDSEGWLCVAKQRNGELGRIPVVWFGPQMSYRPVNFSLEKPF